MQLSIGLGPADNIFLYIDFPTEHAIRTWAHSPHPGGGGDAFFYCAWDPDVRGVYTDGYKYQNPFPTGLGHV